MPERSDTPRTASNRDAALLVPATPLEDARTILINRVAWGAIIAGVVIALVTQAILNMIGLGVGMSTIDPGTGDNPSATSLSIGAGLWFVLSGVIASFLGGWAAGRLSGMAKSQTAAWHGLTAWAATTLVIFYLLGSAAGGIIGGAYSTVTSALGGAGKALGSTAQTAVQAAAPSLANSSNPFASIEQQMRSATGGTDPASMRDAAIASVRAAVTGDAAQAEEAKKRAADALAKAQGIPPDEAKLRVQQYQDQYNQAVAQAKEKATQAADVAAKAVSRGALFGALALILGAIAGWFGGRMGAVDPTLTDRRLPITQ
jgi:hypothetical protein